MISEQDTTRVETAQATHISTPSSQTVVLNPNQYIGKSPETKESESTEEPTSVEPNSESILPNTEDTTSKWFIKDGVAGSGDKPEHLLEKFKNVDDQLKSYTELEKKFGAFVGSPEEYALNISEELGDINLDGNDPLLMDFAQVAEELQMSQDGFDKFLNVYMKHASDDLKSFESSEDDFKQEEIAKLGNDSAEQLDVLSQWIDNQVPDDMKDSIGRLCYDADSIKAVQWIKEQIRSKGIPITENTTGTGLGTRLELQDMMKDKRYGSDPTYTKLVDDSYTRALS